MTITLGAVRDRRFSIPDRLVIRSPGRRASAPRDADSEYGSEEEAARWSPPRTRLLRVGNAVDIEPFDATAWLSKHGAEFGLCQIHRNQPWHYELRPKRPATVAPPCMPTHARSEDAAAPALSADPVVASMTSAPPTFGDASRGDHKERGDRPVAARARLAAASSGNDD